MNRAQGQTLVPSGMLLDRSVLSPEHLYVGFGRYGDPRNFFVYASQSGFENFKENLDDKKFYTKQCYIFRADGNLSGLTHPYVFYKVINAYFHFVQFQLDGFCEALAVKGLVLCLCDDLHTPSIGVKRTVSVLQAPLGTGTRGTTSKSHILVTFGVVRRCWFYSLFSLNTHCCFSRLKCLEMQGNEICSKVQ